MVYVYTHTHIHIHHKKGRKSICNNMDAPLRALREIPYDLLCRILKQKQNPLANVGRPKRRGFNPWVGKIPRRRKRQRTPVFLPGEPHGRKSLVGYISQGHKESDTTELTHHACRENVKITIKIMLDI